MKYLQRIMIAAWTVVVTLSKTTESKASESCLKVKDVVMFGVLCQLTPNK